VSLTALTERVNSDAASLPRWKCFLLMGDGLHCIHILFTLRPDTHQQNNTCVTLFAGAAVMLQPFIQHLAMFMPFSGQVPHFTSSLLLYIGYQTLPIYVSLFDIDTYYNTVFGLDTSLAVAFASQLSYFTGPKYTVQFSHSLVLCLSPPHLALIHRQLSDTSSSSS